MQRRHLLTALASLPLWPLAARANPHAHHGMPAPASTPAAPAPVARQPLSGGAPLREPARLANQSGTAGRFAGTLTLAETRHALLPGEPTRLWTYNGSVPGPVIELTAGDQVSLTLRNRLAESTTVHWHGLPVAPEFDGHPRQAIAPGNDFVACWQLPADWYGTYWYHPHPHGRTARQAAMGLAGAVLARDPADPLAGLPESLLVISDQRFDTGNQVAAHTLADWMDGREGDVVLVNGQHRPRLTVAPGETRRLRVVNACAARYLRLAVPGARLVRVASDGGWLPAPQPVGDYLLVPGERSEFVVTFPHHAGTPLTLVSLPYARQKMMSPEQTAPVPLLDIGISSGREPAAPFTLPATLRPVVPLGTPVRRREIVLDERPHDMAAHAGHAMADPQRMAEGLFLIDGKTYDMERVDLEARVGEVEAWEVVNRSHMDHPFHLHGGRFQLVAIDGRPVTPTWRDTVNLPPRSRLTLLTRFDHPGELLYHCHVLEHEDAGMMATLRVRA